MANEITSADLYLDEIVVILRRMEIVQEMQLQALDVLVHDGTPFYKRWLYSWRHARGTIRSVEGEMFARTVAEDQAEEDRADTLFPPE